MRNFSTLAAVAVISSFAATSAMAGPDVDMSRVTTAGTFNVDVSSTSTAGAAIQGNRSGKVSVNVAANNWAAGVGGFAVGSSSDTNNSGPGVSGFSSGGLVVGMKTMTGGSGFANTRGRATEISTAVVSFGSATVGFDGTFDVKLNTDDWN
jgi:poly(3-hydroxybutyrate) depolymerase